MAKITKYQDVGILATLFLHFTAKYPAKESLILKYQITAQ